MKRFVLSLVALGAVVGLYAMTRAGDDPTATAETTAPSPPATATAPPSTGSTTPVAAAAAGPSPPADARPATVRRLADGDSFDIVWVDTGERDEVRLHGINAPELDACFGRAARETLDLLTAGTTLIVDGVDRDEFGRLVADVWADGRFVNATLVESGAALALSGQGDHATLITAAQESARQAGVGVWAADACGTGGTTSGLVIAAIEADAPGRDNENPNGEWIEVRNESDQPADLTGWTIRDESTRHRYSFPDGFGLDPNGSVRVYSGCGDDDTTELYWCDGDPVWNNGGDTGFLVAPDGGFADTLSYAG